MSCRVVIERIANGYEVEVTDPKLAKQNEGKSMLGAYKSPMREYAFKSIEEVLTFLEKNLDKALPADEYDSSFDEAAAEEEDDE